MRGGRIGWRASERASELWHRDAGYSRRLLLCSYEHTVGTSRPFDASAPDYTNTPLSVVRPPFTYGENSKRWQWGMRPVRGAVVAMRCGAVLTRRVQLPQVLVVILCHDDDPVESLLDTCVAALQR